MRAALTELWQLVGPAPRRGRLTPGMLLCLVVGCGLGVFVAFQLGPLAGAYRNLLLPLGVGLGVWVLAVVYRLTERRWGTW